MSESHLRLPALWLLALAAATAAHLEVACDDPPPDLEAGRLLTLPGDAAGAALVVSDDAAAATPTVGEDADTSSGDETDAGSADGGDGF